MESWATSAPYFVRSSLTLYIPFEMYDILTHQLWVLVVRFKSKLCSKVSEFLTK